MIRKSGIAATALAVGMVLAFANEAAAEGAYVSLMGGYSFLNDSTIGAERDDLNTSVDAITLEDSSAIFGGAIGYSFKEPWRVEVEATYQKYDVEQLLNSVKVLVAATGDVGVISASINGIYEYRQPDMPVTPYIGAGLGAIYADANDVKVTGRSTLNDSAYAPTAVLMLGVGYDLTEAVALTAGYRLQGIGYLDGSNTRSNGSKISGEADFLLVHSATAGLRFSF